jgi:hypothetical protein
MLNYFGSTRAALPALRTSGKFLFGHAFGQVFARQLNRVSAIFPPALYL